MVEIQRILVPLDFSSHSEKALEYAVELARSFGARLDLLHCYQIGLGGVSPYGPVLPQDFGDEVKQAAERKLNDWCSRVREEGLTIECHLSQLFPPEAILFTAEEIGADLIVMGTRGLTGFRHVLLGSVAERTVRTANCPVLTVKAEGEEV